MKEINDEQLLLLAYLEGELTGAGKERAEALLNSDAALQREYNLLAGTRLEPDTTVVYKNKQALKRPQAKPERISLPYILWPATIAACLAWFIMAYAPKAGNANIGEVAIKAQEKQNTATTRPAAKNETIENPVETGEKIAEQPGKIKATVKENNPVSNPVIVEDKVVATQYTMPSTLAAKEYSVEDIQAPGAGSLKLADVQKPGDKNWVTQPEPEKWLAKVERTTNKLLGYLQKPNVSVDKVKTEGNNYWELTLESDAYEVQGRLYTKR